MVDWIAVGFPDHVAKLQSAWDRRHLMLRMYDCGLSQVQIGKCFGICRGRTNQLIRKARKEQENICPVEHWMKHTEHLNGNLFLEYKKIKQMFLDSYEYA